MESHCPSLSAQAIRTVQPDFPEFAALSANWAKKAGVLPQAISRTRRARSQEMLTSELPVIEYQHKGGVDHAQNSNLRRTNDGYAG